LAKGDSILKGRLVDPSVLFHGHLADVRHHRRAAEGRRAQFQEGQEQTNQRRTEIRFRRRRIHSGVLSPAIRRLAVSPGEDEDSAGDPPRPSLDPGAPIVRLSVTPQSGSIDISGNPITHTSGITVNAPATASTINLAVTEQHAIALRRSSRRLPAGLHPGRGTITFNAFIRRNGMRKPLPTVTNR